MNKQQLYAQYIQELAQRQAREQGSLINSAKDFNNKLNRVNKIAQKVSDTGEFLNNKFTSSGIKNIGSTMNKMGDSVVNGVNTFKGFATKPFDAIASKLGTGTAASTGAATTGATTGATTAGTVAGTTAGATTGAAAGTAGATAAGTSAAAGTGAAAGSTAGGASAGAAGGPIGALIALAVMAAMGTHRKAAKKSGQQLMNTTNQMAEQENELSDQHLQQIQQDTANLQQQTNNSIAQGVPTGGAASIQNNLIQEYQDYLRANGYSDSVVNGVSQGLNNGNKEIADWINQYNSGAGINNPINIPQNADEIEAAKQGIFNSPQFTGETAQNTKQGIIDKIASGMADFSRGYNENRNNGFKPENLTNDRFAVTTEKENPALANYQQSLRDKGIDENIVNAVAEGKNSGNKDIANWIKDNPDAYKNIKETQYYDKGKMGRAGEFFGTVGRMVQNPAVQATVAGGLSTALTGNPLYGLGMAYKFGNGRAMSNIYQNVLADNGVEVNPGMFGNLTSSDMNALMTPKYKESLNNIALAKLQESQNYHELMMKYYNDKLEADKDYKAQKIEVDKQNADSRQTSANASVIRANNSGKGKGGTKPKSTKPQDNKDWAGDLARFNMIYSDSKYADKIDIARNRFIGKYEVDPLKYIKQ